MVLSWLNHFLRGRHKLGLLTEALLRIGVVLRAATLDIFRVKSAFNVFYACPEVATLTSIIRKSLIKVRFN
jgi:hypothetical protein